MTNEEDAIVDPTPTSKSPPSHEKGSRVTEITQLYEDALQHYSKVNTTTTLPMPQLVYAEACLKISRFLMTVYLNNGWNEGLLSKIVQHYYTQEKKTTKIGRFMSVSELVKYKDSGITRYSIAKWVTKVWMIDLDDMPLIDQVNTKEEKKRTELTFL